MLCSLNLDADAKALLKTASCCSVDTKKKTNKKTNTKSSEEEFLFGSTGRRRKELQMKDSRTSQGRNVCFKEKIQ